MNRSRRKPSSPCLRSGSLHGGEGALASAEYPGCSWTNTVVIMQCLHDVFRLFSGPAKVNVSFPSGGKTCDVTFRLLCKYLATRPDNLIIRRLKLLMCVYIPVMPLALFVYMCYDVASLWLVRVVRPLFRGIRCFILCIYVLVLYRPLCFASGRSIMFLRLVCSGGGGGGGCLGKFSAGWPPCVGYFRRV